MTLEEKICKYFKTYWTDVDFMDPYLELRYGTEIMDILGTEDYDKKVSEFNEYITEEQLESLINGIVQEANDRIRAFVEDRIAEMEDDNA